MKSPKMILLGGVAALTATVVIAQLTPEQRRAADEALRQKMEELNSRDSGSKSSNAAKPAPAPAPVVKSAPAPAPAPVAAPVVASAPAAKGLTPEQEAAARQVLRNAMAAKAAAAPAPAPAALPPTQPVTPPTVVKTPASNPGVIVAAKSLTPEQEAAAREALMMKMAELNARDAKTTAPVAPQLVVAQPAQPPVAAPVKAQPVAPRAVVGKPMPEGLPISQAQWEEIVALTALYKADRITPTDYHAKRASIIAEGTGSAGGEQ